MKKYLVFFTTVILFACASKKNVLSSGVESEAVVGTWNAEKMEYTLNFETDSAEKVVKTMDDFAKENKMSGVRATYKSDFTFVSSFLDLDGKAAYTEKGEWFSKNDSVYVVYTTGEVIDTQAYSFELNGRSGQFKAILDYDQDGFKDDFLILDSKKEK